MSPALAPDRAWSRRLLCRGRRRPTPIAHQFRQRLHLTGSIEKRFPGCVFQGPRPARRAAFLLGYKQGGDRFGLCRCGVDPEQFELWLAIGRRQAVVRRDCFAQHAERAQHHGSRESGTVLSGRAVIDQRARLWIRSANTMRICGARDVGKLRYRSMSLVIARRSPIIVVIE